MKKSTKKYLIILLVLWIVGCILQYLFCCRDTVSKVVAVAPAVSQANTASTDTIKEVEEKKSIDTIDTAKETAPTEAVVSQGKEDVDTKVADGSGSHGFSLKGSDIELSGKDNFNFTDSDYFPMQPYTEELENNLAKTVDYLNGDPARQLTVTGLYHPKEANPSVFPNLGLARANQVKDYLIFLGANSQQIALDGRAYPEAVSTEDKRYLGMAELSTQTLDDNSLTAHNQAMQELVADIRANPLTLYFKTGATNISLSEKQRQRLLQITNYLDFDASAKAVVTGHTDNTGNSGKNVKLGKERALFVADYLEKNGLRREQLFVDSKGSAMPIADNSTQEGRSKNRRVTISISETSQ